MYKAHTAAARTATELELDTVLRIRANMLDKQAEHGMMSLRANDFAVSASSPTALPATK